MVSTSPSAAAPTASAGRAHPTYTQMITHALTELGGMSGRSAIAGFILGRFTGLPSSHDALLSAHLRRLVAEGVLCYSGFSYLFPGSPKDKGEPDPPIGLPEGPSPLPASSAKRGRGRPPKTHLDLNPDPSGFQSYSDDDSDSDSDDSSGLEINSGDEDDDYKPSKRGPPDSVKRKPGRSRRHRKEHGRPRKRQKVEIFLNGCTAIPMRSGGGDFSTQKRGRGRPRKEPEVTSGGIKRKQPVSPPTASTGGIKIGSAQTIVGSVSTGFKRPLGRPRKYASAGIKRPLGRPRKCKPSEAVSAEAGDGASTGFKRPLGRPRKCRPSDAVVAEAGDGALVQIKRPLGRPRKHRPSEGTPAASVVIKKPLGRSRKYRPSEGTPAEARDAASMGIKRPRGRPIKYRPSEAVSTETGDATPDEAGAAAVAETVDTTPAPETGDGTPAPKIGDAVPAEVGGGVLTGIKRPRGRPRKERPSAAILAETRDAMPTKAGEATPAPETEDTMPTEAGDAMLAETGDATPAPETGDTLPTEAGDAMPTEAGNATPAPETGAATPAEAGGGELMGIKRPRGRPRKERPPATISAETGDAMPAETGDAALDENEAETPAEAGAAASTVIKRPLGRPRKKRPASALPAETGDATPAETGAATPAEKAGDGASTGIKRGRGRPRKEKAEAAVSAETGGAAVSEMEKPAAATPAEAEHGALTRIKRPLGRPRKDRRRCGMPRKGKPEASAMSPETGGIKGSLENPRPVDLVVSPGMNGEVENPRKEKPSAGDIVSMVMRRGGRWRPRKEQQPAFETGSGGILVGDMMTAEASGKQEGGGEKTIALAVVGKEARGEEDGGCVPVSGEKAKSSAAPMEAVGVTESNNQGSAAEKVKSSAAPMEAVGLTESNNLGSSAENAASAAHVRAGGDSNKLGSPDV